MSFYRDFADVYERIFPVRDAVVSSVAARLREPARVLDVGCGTGGLCARLEDLGHACTGIDLDAAMIDAAEARHPGLDVRVLDMRRIGELDGPYGLAACLGNVLPHLDRVDTAGFLGSLHHVLKPGAWWIVQSVNWDRLADRDRFGFPPLDAGDGYVFERRYEGLDGPRCRFVTRLVRDGVELFAGGVSMHPLLRDASDAAHRAAGFSLVDLAADAAGTPFDPAASPGWMAAYRRD